MTMNVHLLRLFSAVVQQGSFSKAAASLFISLPVQIEVASNGAIKHMVQVGLGLAMVSEATIQTELATGRLMTLPIPELVIERNFFLLQVVKRPLSASGQAFLSLLREPERDCA
jgi:LysR family transcriptional regulator, low CO2-responsive transcriptional regulator